MLCFSHMLDFDMMVYAYKLLPVRVFRLLDSDIDSLCIPFAKTPKTPINRIPCQALSFDSVFLIQPYPVCSVYSVK
jgi:hypothetical protein